ncbi:glycine--tRNA ligase subunit beta [Paracoccus jeotgali]|uniref:Glycine--tRNA ligase beta subunit n=1 Tax=Paracoccus jeotgali TaxID=2065379 RepID=A0A2K9MGQ4_9RHOB|nr:glycine--tRNA ligase subunit beta [Paracoccus jeotgali]AUM74196.1 glycine--tRNA ligase subunit beta [Paracoccus jeotgali]
MTNLLIELFSEEIPARMQPRARDDLRRLVTDGLVEAGLTFASAGAFSTPRRLVLSVEGLDPASKPQREERKGPRVDAPEQALQGFLRSTGLTREELQIRDEKKGQVYVAVFDKPGRPAAEIVAEVLTRTIRDFPWPKSMRWGSGSLRWVRPLHAILCILEDESGAEIVPLTVDGITAGDRTHGHRFMAPDAFAVRSFDDYAAKLRRAKVMLDPAERESAIAQEADNLGFARGLEVVQDQALLTEVAGLVEWPVTLMGRIEPQFLDLPPEVLQTSMKEHQKFFSARNPKTGRIEGFVTVANIETPDDGATILAGNQRVLAARLSDAAFFWDNDLRVARARMDDWSQGLASVTFHNKLGSQADRVARIASLAREIAPMVGADPDQAERAARLAKLDLRSSMVGEFPELQGVMGRYYALEAGEPPEIADAARDHYAPLGPSDQVPTAPVSVAVALADKLDTLTGFWAIDEKPTGSKDPFALRRAALGVIRLVVDNNKRLPLAKLIESGLAAHEAPKADDSDAADSLLSFLHDRLKVHLRDQGIRHDIIDAVLAQPGNDDLVLVVSRARALNALLATDDGQNLTQGLKRASNILAQAEERDGVEYSFGADPKFAETDQERALFTALDTAEPAIRQAVASEDVTAALAAIADLRAPIDAFFEAVQVNTDNQIVRRNRLNLLHRIRAAGRQIADFGRIEG